MKKMSVLVFFFAVYAGASVPSADFIISKMEETCIKTRGVNFFGSIKKGQETTFPMFLLKDSGFFAIDTLDKKPKETDKAHEEGIDLGIVSLLIGCEGKTVLTRILGYLSQNGVDKNIVSLGLTSSYEPVFIIGARSPDEKSPQVWIDKYTFLPLLERNLKGSKTFEKWTALDAVAGRKFPRIITMGKGDFSQSIAISEKINLGGNGG